MSSSQSDHGQFCNLLENFTFYKLSACLKKYLIFIAFFQESSQIRFFLPHSFWVSFPHHSLSIKLCQNTPINMLYGEKGKPFARMGRKAKGPVTSSNEFRLA